MKRDESREQRALIEWAQLARVPAAPDVEQGARVADYLFAIPNGGRRSYVTAAILKAEGVKAGVHDLLLPLARQGRHGLWLEMKSATGTMSKPQREWRDRMLRAGYACATCRSADEARAVIGEYLGMQVGGWTPPPVAAEPVRACPKHAAVRSPKLMEAYRAIACQHCGADDGTVCGAHSNWAVHGKGKGLKADDNRCASLCHRCHSQLDQGKDMTEAQRQEMWWAAHVRTVRLLLQLRLWPARVPVPDTRHDPFEAATA